MPSYKAIWNGSRANLEILDNLLCEAFYPPADACSLFKADPSATDLESDWALHAYFENAPEIDALNAFVIETSPIKDNTEIEELPDQDWVAHALEGLGLVEAGKFILYGIHDENKVEKSDLIPIRIDANQAFGTGHHPTTEGCLIALSGMADMRPKNVLDLGTGSAVLAIAARKIWQHDCAIMATDIDATSVDIAAENADLNNAPNINFVHAAGFDHTNITAQAPFDFIFANILAGPLSELSPDVAKSTSTGATIILAGLLAEQEEKVLQSYLDQGFKLSERIGHKTWPVLIMKKL